MLHVVRATGSFLGAMIRTKRNVLELNQRPIGLQPIARANAPPLHEDNSGNNNKVNFHTNTNAACVALQDISKIYSVMTLFSNNEKTKFVLFWFNLFLRYTSFPG